MSLIVRANCLKFESLIIFVFVYARHRGLFNIYLHIYNHRYIVHHGIVAAQQPDKDRKAHRQLHNW